MYCKKCGKFIGTDVDVCEECKQKEILMNENTQIQFANPYQNVNDNQPPRGFQDTSDIKLGMAIAAMVLSSVGFGINYGGILSSFEPLVGIICVLLGFVPSFLGFIFGLMSISDFRRTSHIKSGKRIPLLILGITSVINSATGLLFSIIIIILSGLFYIA